MTELAKEYLTAPDRPVRYEDVPMDIWMDQGFQYVSAYFGHGETPHNGTLWPIHRFGRDYPWSSNDQCLYTIKHVRNGFPVALKTG